MKFKFIQDDSLPSGQIEVDVKSNELNRNVIDFLSKLEKLNDKDELIPVKIEDKIQLVNQTEIVAVEVNGNILTYHLINEELETKGNLKNIIESLNDNFVQISKYAVINIQQLSSLEASFSGNMTAFMQNKLKITISRRYLGKLKEKVGL
ncbi:LytTR family DNA-binding domain-containing protein [Fructilactobacillus sp. Tb1]|uniref:LytTR family DNA-binding domain-containing protein n=1 Tax=Fructilactobacillus sp. Tb1 TaxID=3422304 RepID=UPI003D29BF26